MFWCIFDHVKRAVLLSFALALKGVHEIRLMQIFSAVVVCTYVSTPEITWWSTEILEDVFWFFIVFALYFYMLTIIAATGNVRINARI